MDAAPDADADADDTTNAHDRSRRIRLALAVFMLGIGTLHFVNPKPFMKIVPHVLGHERALVYASGVAEMLSGALLLSPRTKRIGGLAAAATMVAVYPGNFQMAFDAGRPWGSLYAAAVWLRLPLQLPLIAWALRARR